ncbi:MAG: TlpA family protein disulfide reductase [Bacteroidales bacterium]|nr:TlpA family protein disulfide reductase [Bacteroidales bacterium]
MKNILTTLLLFITVIAFSQQNLPPEIKGNWMTAHDSIEWRYSFQPKFAVFDSKFWDYKSIVRQGNEYRIHVVNGIENEQLIINIIDSSTLLIALEEENPILCTNRKAQKPDFRNYDTQAFEEPLLVDDSATVTGFIEDYDPELFTTTGSINYTSALTGLEDHAITKFEIEPDGRFHVKFRMFSPQSIYLIIKGSTYTKIFIKPGEKVMICLNKLLHEVTLDRSKWNDINDWQINHYMGSTGLLSEELILLEAFYNNLDPSNLKSVNKDLMPQLTYLNWSKQLYTHEIHVMDSLFNTMNTSAKARQIMKVSIEWNLLQDLLGMPVAGSEIRTIPLRQQYLNNLPALNTNSELNLLSDSYMSYINYLEFLYNDQVLGGFFLDRNMEYMNYFSNNITDTTDLRKITEWKASNISLNWPELMDTLSKDSFQYDSLLVEKYNNYFNPVVDMLKYWLLCDQKFKNRLALKEMDNALEKFNSDLTGQLYCMYKLRKFQEIKALDKELMDWANRRITHPVLINYLIEKNEDLVALNHKHDTYNVDSHIIDSIACDKNSDVFFQQIMKKFEGKIVYIDFWADWCSPCRAEFEPAAKLKKEFEGKDIVFLNFGLGCRKKLWSDMIRVKQITGYHYWLNKDQSKILDQKFGINTIPHFVLVDKKGNIVDSNAPKPSSNGKIREKLEELLK